MPWGHAMEVAIVGRGVKPTAPGAPTARHPEVARSHQPAHDRPLRNDRKPQRGERLGAVQSPAVNTDGEPLNLKPDALTAVVEWVNSYVRVIVNRDC